MILDLRPDSPPDFSNFLPGPNVEALAALRAHATASLREPLLYLWGDAGVGKTHLLRAWAAALGAPLFDAGEPLPQPPAPALAVDDVERLDPDNQIHLFNLINSAREQSGLILASGNQPAAHLALRPDLATRLAQGLGFRLLPLPDADKAAALAVRAEGRGMRLPEEVIRYLLIHSRRDLRHLLAVVDELDTLSLSRKRPPSLALLKELLQQSVPG
jgi:DnaA family protein